MGIKVVYNACPGGFSLSLAAFLRLREMGNKCALSEEDCEDLFTDDNKACGDIGDSMFCRDISRHDPMLLQVVSELGEAASGMCTALVIHETKGNRYRIDEYDGFESVQEPDDLEWIEVAP